jgi:hypothetical protein
MEPPCLATHLILLATNFHCRVENVAKNQITTMLYQIHTLQIKYLVDVTLLITWVFTAAFQSQLSYLFMVYLRMMPATKSMQQ